MREPSTEHSGGVGAAGQQSPPPQVFPRFLYYRLPPEMTELAAKTVTTLRNVFGGIPHADLELHPSNSAASGLSPGICEISPVFVILRVRNAAKKPDDISINGLRCALVQTGREGMPGTDVTVFPEELTH
jgi:hypothetical protein